MANLSRLPRELVLLVVEEACRIYVHSHAGWVASLCLVCRSVQNVVTPILYARLFIDLHNFAALDDLSRSENRYRLSLVREVHTSMYTSTQTKSDGSCFVDPKFAPLARALGGMRVVSGPSRTIEALAHWNPSLCQQLLSVYVTDTTAMWRALTRQRCFVTVLRSVTYVHLIIDFETRTDLNDDLSALRGGTNTVRFLVFDISFYVQEREQLATFELEDLMSRLDAIIISSFSAVQRLLLRPRCIFEEDAHLMTSCFAAWAEVKRDRRLFVDDVFVPIYDEERGSLDDILDLEDALEGEALWQRGRQLWGA
ncbi:hypothetical protein EXIGLDRAFT_832491 [Exidia glandulosa HHB12029]|uniref:F-box domain-containing protein n=1 Tax=Exidia glandulosa HHB12029 TaxID=1314781 RepID=A0A165LM86_EXIGL|nr:hypothetical protein EXIGLDRAFT_832491 [Exidia glandulosa HHB12029]